MAIPSSMCELSACFTRPKSTGLKAAVLKHSFVTNFHTNDVFPLIVAVVVVASNRRPTGCALNESFASS